MIIGLRRTVLIGTVGAVAGIIILLPIFIGLAFPLPHQLPITISAIQLEDDETIEVRLEVFNPNPAALAVSKIEYNLFANGEPVGTGQLDYSNTPVTGRPQLLPRQSTVLISTVDADEKPLSEAHWKASGMIEVSNAFTLGQREFSAYFQ